MGTNGYDNRNLLPEWDEIEYDDSQWIAAIEASRRAAFSELAAL